MRNTATNVDRLVVQQMVDKEEIFSEIKKRRKLIAQEKRAKRENARELRLLNNILTDLANVEHMEYAELVQFRARLLKLKPIMEADEMANVMNAHPEVDALIEMVDAFTELRRAANRIIREVERQHKIAQRRAAELSAAQGTDNSKMCIVCRKRPRHFGDWCKRCVPEDQRPTGKVA